jgi:site-specific recombinase XerD
MRDLRRADGRYTAGSIVAVDARGALIEDYCLWMMAAGRSPRTVATRRRQVSRFARDVDPITCTRRDLITWLANPRWKPSTRSSNRAAVRSLLAWAVESGVRDDDPARFLPSIKVPASVPHPAPEAALERARLCAVTPWELAMVELAARAGLRRREIATLRFSDLHTAADGQNLLRVVGKGERIRLLPITPDLAAMVRALRSDWVMPSGKTAGEHMSSEHVGHVLSRLLGPGWSGHTLRHRFATRAYAGSHDLLAVQQLLGHASPTTTQGYVAIDMDSLRAASAAAN